MEVLYRSCCGIDVHTQFLVACLLVVDEKGRQHKELRRFSTMTGELQQCVDWLEAARCQAVAMESTGVYWRPPFNLLEGHIETVMIVNAEHLKRVPGRKTDKKDAEWIAELLQFGLLKPSFIPSQEQRELRDLTRLRTSALRRANPVGESAPQNPGGYRTFALIRVDGYHGENGAADPLRSPSWGGRSRSVG
jgi:transposase